jgi:hypothetical protein
MMNASGHPWKLWFAAPALAALLALPGRAQAQTANQVDFDNVMEAALLVFIALPVAVAGSAFAATKIRGRLAAFLIGLFGISLGGGALLVAVGWLRNADFWTRFGPVFVLGTVAYFLVPGAAVGGIAALRKQLAAPAPQPRESANV